MQFVIDGLPYGSPVALAGDTAALHGVTTLAAGPHAVHATYSGDVSFQGSTSSTITQDVILGASATSLGSAPNPSRFGQAVTLTASVQPAGATGSVTFRDGADSLGAATLGAGVATLTSGALGVGPHSLTATYGGDATYAASTSPAHSQTVLPDSTMLVLVSSPNPSAAGHAALLTATVSPAGAGGSVEFFDGADSLGTSALGAGVATLPVTALAVGTHTLSAVYTGDDSHYGSTSAALPHAVHPAAALVAIASSLNPLRLAQAVSFTATVTDSAGGSGGITGTVQFVIDSVAYGSPVALAGGSATVSGITTLAPGAHAVVATYSGNATFAAATSPTLTQQVESPAPVLLAVRDVINDQGGRVKLMWNASYLDLAPWYGIDSYWILRSAPSTAASRALPAATLAASPESAAAQPRAGALVAMPRNGVTTYWEFLASQPAFHMPNDSYVAATTCDSLPGSNPLTAFMIMARTPGGAQWWYSNADSGYSVDNLSPAAPRSFTGTYSGSATALHWARNAESDLGIYRLYRGATAGFVPGAGNLVVAKPDTGYVDATSTVYYYKLCAVDIHGNASGFASLLPSWPAGVDGGGPLALSLEGARPNPAYGGALSVAFTLPEAASARLELVDVGGRRVAGREVGALGAGRHVVALGAERRLPPGLYLLRLSQGARARVTRVVVIE